MTRRGLIALGLAAALVGLPLLAVSLNMVGRYSGLTVERLEPEALLQVLAPHFEITRPDGDGPFPTALLFSGCDGPAPNLVAWAAALREAGWASIMVDSHTPRGFEQPQRWALICAGQLLTGAERAGDVAVALAHARMLPFVDPARIAFVGASHGGWALMEALSMWDHGQVPLTLTRWPEGMPAPGSGQLRGAVLLYPYCGELSRANWQGWFSPIPLLFLLVEGDVIADEGECLEVARRAMERGLPVEAEVLTGLTHAFDHPDTLEISPNVYDPVATERALARMVAFLDATLEETPGGQSGAASPE